MNQPEWWTPKADKRRQNGRSRSQERKVAREVGGRTQAGSGTSWRARGDVKTPHDLVEVKYTDGKGFRLEADVWERLHKDSLRQGREPSMIIEFTRTGRRLLVTELPE